MVLAFKRASSSLTRSSYCAGDYVVEAVANVSISMRLIAQMSSLICAIYNLSDLSHI